LNLYMQAAGATRIRQQYPERDVVMLCGSEDKDPADPILEVTCAAMLQGSQRLERAQIYSNYLNWYYGRPVHQLVLVQGVGHNGSAMLSSIEGLDVIFHFNR